MGEKATLLKFGKREHLFQLRNEGLLYLNALPYFGEIEDGGIRGDCFDGVEQVARGHKAKLKAANGAEIPLNVTNWTFRIHPFEPERMNLFCMYACRPSLGTFPVNDRNNAFGDHVLVMTNPQRFLDQVASTLKTQGIQGKFGLVEYVDDEHTGQLGPFRKLKKFAFQSDDGPGEARMIRIGSLGDISKIIPTNEMHRELARLLTE